MLHRGYVYVSKSLWVALMCLSITLCQEISEIDNNATTTSAPLFCFNGEFVEGACVCQLGWTGTLCDVCNNARIKLTEDSGLIFDGSENYRPFTECLFYVEADSSVTSIHLRVRSFQTECQWDALSVFSGDSIFHPKIAAYTGDIIELPLEEPTVMMENATASMDPVPVQYQDPREITLSGSGSQMLLYFYSDLGSERPGFEIAYWLDYGCPDNCSGQGVCGNGSCSCDPGWTGTFCQLPVCPNNCSGNGICDDSMEACNCSQGFTGADCSIDISSTHWERVTTAPLPDTFTLSTLARGSHSAVVWGGYMLVYGGYRFPTQDYYYRPPAANETMTNVTREVSILRYHFVTKAWEEVKTYPSMNGDAPSVNSTNGSMIDDKPGVPQPRYGHSAVVYNDTMYVYGGALLPSEEITNELWALDLTNLTWTFLPPPPVPVPVPSLTTEPESATGTVTVVNQSVSEMEPLPLAVRSHTSHLVGNKMVTLFGLSPGRSTYLSCVQEYNLDTGVWTLPHERGILVGGRLGHSSVYDPLSGLIYVHGGALRANGIRLHAQALVLDTATYSWSAFTSLAPQRYLHSSVLIGPLLVTFGGCEVDDLNADCFTNTTHVFNTLCDTWTELSLAGLPGNSSRYGHSSVVDSSDGSLLVYGGFLGTFHHDLLRLVVGDCSQFVTEDACVNGSGLCAWSGVGECVSVGSISAGSNSTYRCQVDPCLSMRNCRDCNNLGTCAWNSTLKHCASNPVPSGMCAKEPADSCSYYKNCIDCTNHDCSWGRADGEASCVTPNTDPSFNESACVATTSCFSHSTCGDCTSTDCLWCPSIGQCVNSYPLTYVYAQCLGWVNSALGCPLDCEGLKNCSECQDSSRCGWCNDPLDTGRGQCVDGGFTGPRANGSCDEVGLSGLRETWNFDQCPACQCNGHSACMNGSICDGCQNNTVGDTCDTCELGYFGDARNGGNCSDCDCNGYNPVCNDRDGTCTCLSFFVDGPHCERCSPQHPGDPSNFCYDTLTPGFIYTFTMTEDRQVEGFYVVTPTDDVDLHFRIEVSSDMAEQPLTLQLFLGKLSEDLWILANLTDPMQLSDGQNYDETWGSFSSNSNETFAQLFSFTNPMLRNSLNYTELLEDNSENEYTSRMWDTDVSLVVFLSGLSNPTTLRITVDQQDLYYLLYFFATFAICFSILLLLFLGGWYIKRKIEYRIFIRAQYAELQRRVARPFARIKTIISPVPPPTVDSSPPPQHPSYVAVETCRSGKAAVLSLFIRLPGDHKTGRPCPGRSGLAIGSTLVGVNSMSKKPKDKSKKKREGNEEEQSRGRSNNTSRNRIRLRDISSLTTST